MYIKFYLQSYVLEKIHLASIWFRYQEVDTATQFLVARSLFTKATFYVCIADYFQMLSLTDLDYCV